MIYAKIWPKIDSIYWNSQKQNVIILSLYLEKKIAKGRQLSRKSTNDIIENDKTLRGVQIFSQDCTSTYSTVYLLSDLLNPGY